MNEPEALEISLTKRVERERRARLEAEAIAERGMRDLYAKQRELSLLIAIAGAANEAATTDEAIRFALTRICEYARWPLGHVYHVESNAAGDAVELVSGEIWNAEDASRFEMFRQASEAIR